MAKIAETFNFGNEENMSIKELLVLLERMYTNIALAVNQKPDLYQRNVDGSTSDTFLAQGAININLSSNKVEILTNHTTPTAVVWTTLS